MVQRWPLAIIGCRSRQRSILTESAESLLPELIYRTGDLGRYNEYGEILFGGRKDYQIKYMGHRIELEEIERAMEDIEGISRAC